MVPGRSPCLRCGAGPLGSFRPGGRPVSPGRLGSARYSLLGRASHASRLLVFSLGPSPSLQPHSSAARPSPPPRRLAVVSVRRPKREESPSARLGGKDGEREGKSESSRHAVPRSRRPGCSGEGRRRCRPATLRPVGKGRRARRGTAEVDGAGAAPQSRAAGPSLRDPTVEPPKVERGWRPDPAGLFGLISPAQARTLTRTSGVRVGPDLRGLGWQWGHRTYLVPCRPLPRPTFPSPLLPRSSTDP